MNTRVEVDKKKLENLKRCAKVFEKDFAKIMKELGRG